MKTRKLHWKQYGARSHDGFRVVGTEGGYMFVEGRKPSDHLLTYQEYRNLEACAKRRGIGKGFFVIENPRENGQLEPLRTGYQL